MRAAGDQQNDRGHAGARERRRPARPSPTGASRNHIATDTAGGRCARRESRDRHPVGRRRRRRRTRAWQIVRNCGGAGRERIRSAPGRCRPARPGTCDTAKHAPAADPVQDVEPCGDRGRAAASRPMMMTDGAAGVDRCPIGRGHRVDQRENTRLDPRRGERRAENHCRRLRAATSQLPRYEHHASSLSQPSRSARPAQCLVSTSGRASDTRRSRSPRRTATVAASIARSARGDRTALAEPATTSVRPAEESLRRA